MTFGLYRNDGCSEPSGYVASVRDISKRKEAEAQLAHLARHDPLTGLPNRMQFQESLEREVARARRNRTGFALHCLDLDRFKAINDTFGHLVGDRLLRAVADRLRAAFGPRIQSRGSAATNSSSSRPGPIDRGAVTMAERLIASLSSPFDLGEHQGQIGVSIGIVLTDGAPSMARPCIPPPTAHSTRRRRQGAAPSDYPRRRRRRRVTGWREAYSGILRDVIPDGAPAGKNPPCPHHHADPFDSGGVIAGGGPLVLGRPARSPITASRSASSSHAASRSHTRTNSL